MSFVATPPPNHAWTETDPGAPITSDGWWPQVSPDEVRSTIRVNGTITEARLIDALKVAIIMVNRELSGWQSTQQAKGYTTLAEVPAPVISGSSALEHLYKRAVYQTARADLIERYRDFDTTGAGDKRAEDLTDTVDEARRNARWAVQDILGQPHLTVELI